MATWGSIRCGCSEIPKNKACWNDCTHIAKYLNIFVRYLRIFEYIRTPTFQCSEYDSFSDKVANEVTQSEKNTNQYFLGTPLPYS